VIAAGKWSSELWPRHAAAQSGDLGDVPVAPLLCAFAAAGSTVVIELEHRQVRKSVVLEHGVPVDCRSNLVHETLGRFLVAQNKLDAQALSGCLAEAAARDLPLGEVLLERGLVQPVDLYRLLQQNLAKKLLDLFAWTDGTFRVSPEVPVVRSALRVRVPQLVLTGITRFAPQEQINGATAALVGERLGVHPAPPFEVGELRLSPLQSRVLEALRRGGRLDELAAAAEAPAEELSRVVVGFMALGIALPATEAQRLRAKAPVAQVVPAPASVAPEAAPTPSASPPEAVAGALAPALVAALGNDIMQAFLRYRAQDAFDFLGLPEDATPLAIENRYLELAARWAGERFVAAELTAFAERARDLFLAAARAYAELASTEQRSALLFRRRTLREQAGRRPAQHAIRTDLLDPEVQFRKGKEFVAGGRLREAVAQFEFAADCDPQNGLYRAELTWTRYQLSPTSAPKLLGDLEEAVRADPECGLASYYAGMLAAETGNFDRAESHLRVASRRMTPDRRPIEALKSLAAKRRR
jgi:hypothetical protein